MSQKPHVQTQKYSVHVTCGRGLVLLSQCNTLCTIGFVDDVTFPIISRMAAGVGSINVGAVPASICQRAAHCLTVIVAPCVKSALYSCFVTVEMQYH